MNPLPPPTPPVPPVLCGQLAPTELADDPSLMTGADTHRPVLSSQQTVALGAYTASLQKSCKVLISGGTGTDEGISKKIGSVVFVSLELAGTSSRRRNSSCGFCILGKLVQPACTAVKCLNCQLNCCFSSLGNPKRSPA